VTWRGWPCLLALLAHPDARAQSLPACPPDAEIRRLLGVDAETPIACRVGGASVLMGAIVPFTGVTGKPHVIVALDTGNAVRKGEADLEGTAREPLPKADDWQIAVAPANLYGASWSRVDVTAAQGDDRFAAQTVVSFFRGDGHTLGHVWTGLGDRHEKRFDACRLDTTARFALSAAGALVRTRHTTRTFAARPDLSADTLATLKAECVAAPPTRDSFVVADDGVDADVPLSNELRAQARENRRLFLRARRSPEDLGRFITHSLAMLPLLETEVMDATPPDPELSAASISTTAAEAYMMDSSGGSSLKWGSIVSAAGPRGRALALALGQFRGGEGAWISSRTDYGGCHQPEQATKPLRELVGAWNAAPAAFREAFAQVMARDLREMTTNACFCDHANQRAKIQRALDRNAALLERLAGPGPEAAAALRALLGDEHVKFNCSPG